MKNTLYRLCVSIAHFYFKAYYSIFNPLTLGVRGIVLDSQGKILLVKHRYDHKWYLPGGQVKKKETLIQALERELKEETAISFTDETKIDIFGCYSSLDQGKSDHIVVFTIRESNLNPAKNCIEIKDMGFLALDDLPSSLSPGTRRRLQEFKQEHCSQNGIW